MTEFITKPLNCYSTFLEYSVASLLFAGAILPYHLLVMGLHEQPAHRASTVGPKAWVPGAGLHLQGRAAPSVGLRRPIGDITRKSPPGLWRVCTDRGRLRLSTCTLRQDCMFD